MTSEVLALLIYADGRSRSAVINAPMTNDGRIEPPDEIDFREKHYRLIDGIFMSDGYFYHVYVEQGSPARERFSLHIASSKLRRLGLTGWKP